MAIIRKAAPEDASAIIELMKELIDEHRQLDVYYKPWSAYQGLAGYIKEAAHDPKKLLLVAEDSGKVIGYFIGAIEEAPYYSSEKKIGIVADTAVTSGKQRAGVLKTLFSEALKWFSKKGIKYIELSVDARNVAAIAAWRSLGFSDYKLRLLKKIGE